MTKRDPAKLITIRLQRQLIRDLKVIAKARKMRGYQTLIKSVLAREISAALDQPDR